MKKQNPKKILTGTVVFALFIAGCSRSSSDFNEQEWTQAGPSRRKDSESSDIEYLGHSYPAPMIDNTIVVCNKSYANIVGRISNQCSAPVQCNERPSVIKHTSNYLTETNRLSMGEKRKESEMGSPANSCTDQFTPEKKRQKRDSSLESIPDNVSHQSEICIMPEDSEQPAQDDQAEQSAEKSGEKKDINEFNINLWNVMSQRLENRRRKSHRINHKTVFMHYHLDNYIKNIIKTRGYKENVRRSIEDFAANVAPLIKINPMWHFISSKSTHIYTKYKDLLGLQEFFRYGENKHREILEGIQGYYPAIFDDMIAYIEKHQPLMVKKDDFETAWKETLGDVYMRKPLTLKYSMLEDLNSIEQMDKKYHPLAQAVHMVLVLPEVYQDFSGITDLFIRWTKVSENRDVNSNYQKVLLRIKRIVHLNIKKETNYKLYEEIYSCLEEEYEKEKKPMEERTAAELYKDLYTILVKFYEEAAVFDKQNQYILVGKCIITGQKYMKCEKLVDISQDVSRKGLATPAYTEIENRWTVSSDISPHYHVYYVDNTTHQLKTLCMPIYVDKKGQKHYLHTVDEIVAHIKSLYKIKINLDHVHPFKVKKGTKEWTYVKKKDRSLRVKDLAGYEVVFYYIEEDLEKAKFTFAYFKPLKTQISSKNIHIPLFLAPLMQSAVEFGPFEKKGEHQEIESIDFVDKKPSAYKYSSGYATNEYSDIHKYYSNLYILPDKEKKKSAGCYLMDCKTTKKENNIIKAVWHVRMQSSVDEYTNFLLDKSFKEEEDPEKLGDFINTLESREYNKDSELQGFWLRNSNALDMQSAAQTETVHTWIVSHQEKNHTFKAGLHRINILKKKIRIIEKKIARKKEKRSNFLVWKGKKDSSTGGGKSMTNRESCQKSKDSKNLEILHKELREAVSEKPDEYAEVIVFRNVNDSKSNLGTHNEILDVLISWYNQKKSR
ncbi:hypothetical protein NEMIN01_2111 [Nematocida minor]|uniref:uncharacterized protein n=1 Tax=Nematocida minor TaxID=1912983 RepID=UPI00221FF9A4|nr:uncharacterized protein NEMIN01_2111 [Nematocida minor]KAI5192612.1 hypothetical protein NEMIN01_2111 [Nematocida minor]